MGQIIKKSNDIFNKLKMLSVTCLLSIVKVNLIGFLIPPTEVHTKIINLFVTIKIKFEIVEKNV